MSKKYKIEIKDYHKVIEVDEDMTILEIMEENKLEMDSDCRAGTCGTCRAKLIKGEVENSEAVALTEEEKQKGYILLCCAYPRSDCEILLLGKSKSYE